MSKKSKKICDRCGAEIYGYGNTVLTLNKFARLRMTTWFSPDPYCYADTDMDLCHDCTQKLEEFLSESEVKNNG